MNFFQEKNTFRANYFFRKTSGRFLVLVFLILFFFLLKIAPIYADDNAGDIIAPAGQAPNAREQKENVEMAAPQGKEPAPEERAANAAAFTTSETAEANRSNESCHFLTDPVRCLVLPLFKLACFILSLAGTVFVWIIDTKNIDTIFGTGGMQNVALYESWTYVRDILNMVFIMALLFSAFCTIFQVAAYNLKKMLWKIVLMALLVNFSWPITRFIIDFANILMYSIIKSDLFSRASVESTLVNLASTGGALGDLVTSTNFKDNTTLLAATIEIFMLAITLLAVGVLLLSRLITLAILLVLSPAAFVGSLVPFLSSQASKWWDALFKNAFFGPILIFGVILSVKLMTGVGKDLYNAAGGAAQSQGTIATRTVLGSVAFIAVPIVLLWVMIGVSQSLSIIGAGAVTNRARKAMSWFGMTFSGANFVRGTYQAYKTRRGQAAADSWRNRLGTWAGSKQDQWRGIAPGRAGRDAANRYQRDLANKVEQEKKRRDMENMSTTELGNIAEKGNRFERAAAIQELANKGQATEKQLQKMGTVFGTTSQVFTQLANKIKTYDPVAAFNHLSNVVQPGKVISDREQALTDFVNSNQFDAKKINYHSLGNDAFMRIAFKNQAISNKDLEEARKKGSAYQAAITTSLGNIAGNTEFNLGNPGLTEEQKTIARNVHMANFAQTGVLHSSIAGNFGARQEIFSRLDKETAKRMKAKTVTDWKNDIAENINAGQYKDIIRNMEDNSVRRDLNDHIGSGSHTGGTNAKSIENIIHKDSYLNNL